MPRDRRPRAAVDADPKAALFEQFARVGKALANPHRLVIVELLAQGERSVDVLARQAGVPVGLASAHLQVLRRAGLVVAQRQGTHVIYQLADDEAYRLVAAVQSFAVGHLAETGRAARAYLGDAAPVELVSRQELLRRVMVGDAIVIDLRPTEEYLAGHIAGALSLPLSELEARLADLPTTTEVVAYCRGPFCALAPQGVELLRRSGRRARRLQGGFPDWRSAGLPVAVGPAPA